MGGTTSSEDSNDIKEEDIPEGNGFIFFGQVLPAEMCEEVFLNVPTSDLIRSLPKVCSYWHHLLTKRKFWFHKLEREGIKLSEATEMRLAEERDDGKVLRILQGICGGYLQFNSNLIRNPSGEDKFKHWVVERGGDGLIVECPPVGSHRIPEEAGLPTQHCFVSSYYRCVRSQSINLKKLGIKPWMMDILRPEMKISEWVSARWDCAAESQILVNLLRGSTKQHSCTISWSSEANDNLRQEWYKVEEDIPYNTYGSNLTAIEFTNTSKDSQFWAGHYGAKTAGSSVILQL